MERSVTRKSGRKPLELLKTDSEMGPTSGLPRRGRCADPLRHFGRRSAEAAYPEICGWAKGQEMCSQGDGL
jgi:hypothetical protein